MEQEHPPAPNRRPLVIFDGDCGFCRRWIDRWREETGDAVDYAPFQEAAERFPSVPRDAFRHAVHYVDVDGTIRRGADAVFRTLSGTWRGRALAFLYEHVPGARAISEAAYRWVADHRPLTDRLTLLMWGKDVRRPRWRLGAGLFLRGLALVYVVAFLSLLVQVRGLVGSSGILPAADFLEAVHRHFGASAYLRAPTLAWFGAAADHLAPTLAWLGASDAFLVGLCGAGALSGFVAFAGIAPFLSLAVCWLLYLSLTVAGQTFLGFQWDNLLIETGFLAVFLAPFAWRTPLKLRHDPPRAAVFLLQWLLFRLMFSSGVVKISSGDPSWHALSALHFHWETQCLPAWPAWYAHLLPPAIQVTGCALMFVVELVLPLLIFLPRRLRLLSFGGIVFLQALIALTGNYGFFNLLTVVLCLLLIDDVAWSAPSGRRHETATPVSVDIDGRSRRHRVRGMALAALWILSWIPLMGAFRARVPWPPLLIAGYEALAPFRIVNGYGLFAVMTTTRSEIAIEGSEDGVTWRRYPFRWKPGDPSRRPGYVAPHMPRLDWQMWFAALGDYRASPWLPRLEGRLLEGSPPILDLLGENPFPDGPPRYVRTVTSVYRFTTAADRRASGDWWREAPSAPFGPTLVRN